MAKGISVPVTATGLDASISNAVKKVGAINIPVNVDPSAFKNLAQPLGRVSGLATEFEKSIAASNARVLAFGASVGIINGVQNAFASLLQTGIEVQKTLAEIAAISGQSGEALAKFGDSLFEVGKLTGQSFKTAAQAALEFSRQGLSTEETLKRTTDALTLTRFTTLNAAEAVDVLTAAANSFGDTGITTTEILNKLVAVDTKFAVSAEDLANGLARAGSIAQEVGVSFDELNAAITVAQERTARGGSVIGNALKTIFTRLRSDETVQALRAIGVESLNAQGGLKGAIPLLEEVAQKLEGLSEGERVQILEAIASKYNINILSAILTDLSDANKKFGEVVGISASAGNQAYERQIELNKILDAQINITTLSVQQLFNKLAEIGVTESLTNLLKFVNGLLDGINKILDSESTGGNIAKGLIKGISEIFFTVGLPLLGAIFIKLTKDIAQFGVESLKTILGINQQVRERQALEQAVVNTLIRDQEIMATILSLSGNRAKQEEYLLSVYNRQLAALQQVQSIAAGVAPALQAAGLSATSGTIKRRAAGGYLPAEEARDVRRGVGGASPSSKVVEIPNFSFGGGKRGTMVANTSEYIVPNYAGGSGTAVFNQDMVKQYGLPPGAKKITASGGFVPANGFVPNFVNFNVKRPQVNPTDAEKIKKGAIDYINLVGTEPSAYLTLAKDPDGAMIGRFSELQQIAKEKIENVFGKNKVLPSAIVQGQDNVLVKQIQSSYKTEAGVVKPTFNNAGTLVGKIFDYKKAIKKKDAPAAEQLIKDISFGLVPETSGALDQDVRQKFQEKIKTEIERDQNPVFAAGKILENSLFASIQRQVVNDNNRTWDLPSQISEEFKNAFGISNKVKFAEVKLGKTEKSMSSFLGKHIMSPSGTNASRGYIPNFINSGFVWTGAGERLENYGAEDVVPAGNATRGKKWERVKANYRAATQEELNTFAAKAAKQMNENISVTAEHPAGAVMLVPKQEQARAVNKQSQGFGVKPKDGLKTPEGEGINFVKFAAFGVNDEKFKSKSGAKMSDIQMRIKDAIGSVGADIANDFKVLTKEPLDKDGFYKLFDKKQGAGGSVSAVAGSIFEAATDYTLNPAGNPDFSDPDTSFDVGSLTPNLIDVFDIKGDYGPGTKADFKISEARDRAFADQVVLNKVYKKVDKTTGLVKAAKGYIPNFAGKYYYDPNLIAKEDDVVKGEDGKDVKNATLKKALASRKRINVLIGPVGSGKTTFAQASGGTFLRKPSDVDLADEITILQTSHTSTKTGGISDNMRQILDAATGQISYLDVSDEVISERRKVRSAQAEAGQIVGDTRSTKQIVSGDQFAEKKSPTFIQAVQEYLKTKGKTLNMIKGSEGYIPNFAPADPLSSLATTKQFKNDSSSSAGLEESINTAAKNAYKPFSKRKNITAGVSKNLVGNEAGTKKFRDALNSGIPVADFIGFQAATVGAPRPNISGKPEDLEKDLASLRFFNKDINGPRPALRAVTKNPDENEPLAPAGQFYDLKTALGFADAATVSLNPISAGRKAAEGYIPNFASQNAIDAMRRIIADDRAPEGEKRAAALKLAQATETVSSINPKAVDKNITKTNVDLTGINPEYFEQQKKNYAYYMGLGFTKDASLNVLQGVDRARGTSTIDQLPKLKTFKQKNQLLFAQLETFVKQPNGRATIEKILKDNSALSFQEPEKSAVRGFVPNFVENEPLKEAINREVAAGVSPARVRVTQDDRLQNSKNPQGLAVINTRDEPNGKIPNNFRKRVAIQEVASAGFVPNFAKEKFDVNVIRDKAITAKDATAVKTELETFAQKLKAGSATQEQFNAKAKELSDQYKISGPILDKYNAEVKTLGDAIVARRVAEVKAAAATAAVIPPAGAAPAAAPSAGGPPAGVPPIAGPAGAAPSGDGKSGKGLADSTEKTKVGLDKMFYALSGITTLSYTLQSVFKDTESSLAKLAVGFTSAAQTASQFGLAGGVIRDLTEGLADKGGALGMLGKAGRFAGPAGLVLGAGVGIYQSFQESNRQEAQKRDASAKTAAEQELEILRTKSGSEEDFLNSVRQELFTETIQLDDLPKRRKAALDEVLRENKGLLAKDFTKIGKLTEAVNKKFNEEEAGLRASVATKTEVLKKDETLRPARIQGEEARRLKLEAQIASEAKKKVPIEQAYANLIFNATKNKNDQYLKEKEQNATRVLNASLQSEEEQRAVAFGNKRLEIARQKTELEAESFIAVVSEIRAKNPLVSIDEQILKNLQARLDKGEEIKDSDEELNKLGFTNIASLKLILNAKDQEKAAKAEALRLADRELVINEKLEKSIRIQNAALAIRAKIIKDATIRQESLGDIKEKGAREIGDVRARQNVFDIERKISLQPFATREDEYNIARAQAEFRRQSQEKEVTNALTDKSRNAFRGLRDYFSANIAGLKPVIGDTSAIVSTVDETRQSENLDPRINAQENVAKFRTVLSQLQTRKAELEKELQKREGDMRTDPLNSEFVADVQQLRNQLDNLGNVTNNLNNEIDKYNEMMRQAADLAEEQKKQFQEILTYQMQLFKLRKENPFKAGIVDGMNEIKKEQESFQVNFGKDLTIGFRDGLRDALSAAISQTDDLNGALQAVAINFLKTLQGKFLNQAADQITLGLGKINWSSVGQGISNWLQGNNSASGATSTPMGPYEGSKGGYIKGYADGGKVIGGSGVRDDVPAMLSAGEYVIRKSSVQKYGENNLKKLNSGEVPKFADGGFFLPGVRGGTAISGYKDLTAFANQITTSGTTDVLKGGRSTAFANLEDQSQRLSAYALLNKDDLINQEVRSAQEQGLSLIKQREAYRTAQRKALQKELVGLALSMAASYGASKLNPQTPYSSTKEGMMKAGAPQALAVRSGRAYGGMIKRYNSGGGPTDDIPALLMGGEYVMSRQTTRKYGKQFFDSINQGRAPRFAEGGSVPTSESSYAEKSASSSETKARNAPNVTININVTKDSSRTESEGDTEDENTDYRKMSEQIKMIVLDTINEEKRLGGSLRPRS